MAMRLFARLNTSGRETHIEVMGHFHDREPAWSLPIHARFNDLSDPETVPQATKYASVVDSDVPMVAQHICLDSRQAEDALLTAILPGDCRSFDIGALFGFRGFHEGLQKD